MNPEKIMQELAGNPDYAAIPVVWPWPDGGYHASIILIDKRWAEEQDLLASKLEETRDWGFSIIDGFTSGITVGAPTMREALEKLKETLETIYNAYS